MSDKAIFDVRIASLSDASEIARLNALFNGVDEPAENYARRMNNARCVDTPILAEMQGRIIGLANLRLVPTVFYTESYAELTELFVEEEYRRRGVGQALIVFAERLAREAGALELIILTDFENRPAQSLYRSLGYTRHDLALSKSLL